MTPRDVCGHPPIWMCDTCEEFGCRPVIFSSMVVERWPAETAMVPVALAVLTGLSWKEKALGLGEGKWPGDVAWVGVGDGVEPASPPHAAAHVAIAAIASDVMAHPNAVLHRVPGIPVQVTGGGWDLIPASPPHWLEMVARPGWPGRVGTRNLIRLRVPRHWRRRAPATPEEKAKAREHDQRSDRAERGDDVVDGRDEVVRGVVQRCRKTPAVARGSLRRRPGLAEGDRNRAVRSVVVQVLDLALELLDLAGDLADLVLHGDDVVDRLRVREQRAHRVQLRLGVGQACAQVDVLRADVGPGNVLALDVPDLRQRVDRGVEVGRRDHEVDDAGPDRAGLVSA